MGRKTVGDDGQGDKEATEIANYASRNLAAGDLQERKGCVETVSVVQLPSRYVREDNGRKGERGKAKVKEKRGNVRDEYVPRYFKRSRPRPTWRT